LEIIMHVKSITRRPLALVLLALAAAASAPSFAASTTASASAKVMIPISITKASDLSVGKFVAGASGGTVVIDTAGAATKTGSVVLVGAGTTAASFTIGGEPGTAYTITMDSSATLTNTAGSGGETMALTLQSDLGGTGGSSGTVSSGTLSAGGAQSVYVGGSLDVAGSQVPGDYVGSIAVAVDYQ
jgi:hypothetical protein